jgi:shikimate kinase
VTVDASRHLVLVGLMGVGKSTVGPRLAAATGRSFIDLDDEVAQRCAMSVGELITAHGEPYFRRAEADALADVLARREPVVLATGGGAVANDASRRLLIDGPVVVWLTAPVDTLVQRVGEPGERVLLAEGPRQVLARLAAERDPLYREVADVTVSTDGDSPDGVVDAIVAAVGPSLGVRS